jgi:hypothetical protein
LATTTSTLSRMSSNPKYPPLHNSFFFQRKINKTSTSLYINTFSYFFFDSCTYTLAKFHNLQSDTTCE